MKILRMKNVSSIYGFSSLFILLVVFIQGQGAVEVGTFECEDEGFYPHPADCKKYFWCLDSSPANLGLVAHAFTCPSGLFFNTKTEACDYPNNVACKQKKSADTLKKEASRPPTDKKPKTSTTTEAPTTTTPSTTTTSSTTTTTTPAPTSPRITPELLAAALRINEKQQQDLRATTPQPDSNLDRLLDLVQSLGGIEKLQALVNNKNQGANARRPDLREAESLQALNQDARPCTTHGYFEPSYATPPHRDLARLNEPTTETPLAVSSNEPKRQTVRHRRPQFDSPVVSSSSSPATANPLFTYVDPTRDHQTPAPANSPFAFSYNTPGGRVHHNPPVPVTLHTQPSTQSARSRPQQQQSPRVSPAFNDPFFSYNTPGRQPTTRAQVAVTEPTVVIPQPPEERQFVRVRGAAAENIFRQNIPPHDHVEGERHIVRVPVRVTSGNGAFRDLVLDQQPPQPTTARRQPNSQRIRLQSTFAVAPNPNLPGVLYDEELIHEFPTAPPAPTTRKPARRRPPQREHLRNRQEENPVSALINLPPPNLPPPQFGPIQPAQLQPRPLPPRPHIPPQAIPATLPPRPPPTTTQPPFTGFPPLSSGRNNPPRNQFSSLLSITPPQQPTHHPLPTQPVPQPQPQPLPTISDLDERDIFVTDFPFYDISETEAPTTTNIPIVPTTTTTTTTLPPPTTTQRSRQQRRKQQPQRGQQLPNSPPAPTTPKPTRRTTLAPLEETGPAVEMDPKGSISCGRRGVYAHPSNCGMFVVCAPATRGSTTFRSYTHHCPADQVFVEEFGRCRPGNKEKCEVFKA